LKQKLLSVFPFMYQLRISQLRIQRYFKNRNPSVRFARQISQERFAYTNKKHQSLLRRKLGSSDPILQENKITNLRLSIAQMDGIIIQPGEIFSFWKLVGKPSASKGYIAGLLLSQGGVKTGIGGGICQLANLLYWLALHSPLAVIERHHHSFDPFPDENRVLPFGSGASVFYNYVDLRLFNATQQSFQFSIWLTEEHLKGTLQSDAEWPYSYHIIEKNHRFIKKDEKNYRENEIWRKVIDKKTGQMLREELLIHNFSEIRYDLLTETSP
jgi:vancomycin resistance protein VanW